jgi:hybrid cluster-associated redox disulfide protein
MEQPQITSDMIIADIFTSWPKTVPVFLKHRMGCVGCSMAHFEPLHRALEIYKLPAQDFVADLHVAINSTEK